MTRQDKNEQFLLSSFLYGGNADYIEGLYARYKQEGEPFVARYVEFLAQGGSRKPAEMLAELGIDIREKSFWQGGVDLIRGMVDRARELSAAF